MHESDLIELEKILARDLAAYDWATAAKTCADLIETIDRRSEPFALPQAKRILYGLRRKRRFDQMSSVAEAIIRSGQNEAAVMRQYAQSLIDQGLLSAAALVLEKILGDPEAGSAEKLEAFGLAGRVDKQQFVNLAKNLDGRKREFLERSIDQYLAGYALDKRSYWHSINAAALLMRGERDGIKLPQKIDAKALAAETLALLNSIIENSSELPKPWEYATLMETQIALGRFDEAFSTAISYTSSSEADAFELNSTLRQLVEIWQLDDAAPPGDKILPVLRAALLEREGGSIRLTKNSAKTDGISLESAFGDNAPKTIRWYKEGLERTNSVARIELADGKGIGTAGLFNGKDFFPDIDQMLCVTNSHVVSASPGDSGLPPNKVRINIQGIAEVFEVDKVVWSSPQRDLDVSFLSLKGTPRSVPLPVSQSAAAMADPAPRVYVIGHPNGRDLEISLNDSRMVGANERYVHYRTPTEPGSSGSPVFDQYGWEVVAIHHGGSDDLPRIDGAPGTYQANEGIAVSAIREAISRRKL
ncbi:MAG: trypsin-like peptidase domain-containing protein [Acidobacteria bacterium]|nr:trypsin-like peptidase domain-containing protein [Acidobacteriota bacterium]